MLWCCIDMRLAVDRRENLPTRLTSAPGGEFRVSPRDLLSGVSLPGSGTAGVSVDERVEGASRRPSWFVLLDMDQVEQAAQVCPLVEPHLSVASFDDPDQASDEVDGVRTVIPLAANSVDLHGGWLVHVFSPRREGPAGTEGGKPQPNPAVNKNLAPWWPETVKHWRTLH